MAENNAFPFVLPAKGRGRKGKERARRKNHASARHRSRYGPRAKKRTPLLSSSVSFSVCGMAGRRDRRSGARKTRRGSNEAYECVRALTPALSPPFIASISLPIPPPRSSLFVPSLSPSLPSPLVLSILLSALN